MKAAIASLVALVAVAGGIAAEESTTAEAVQITRDEMSETGELDAGAALALNRPDVFRHVDASTLINGLPVLTLLDGRRLPISSDLARMGFSPADVFPVAFLSRADVYQTGALPRYGSDAVGGTLDLRLNRMHSGGEVGFFYGRSDGKYAREDFQTYIIGTVGNDRFQITAGAVYQETNRRVPQPRRFVEPPR